MKATVVQIASATQFNDGKRRITLRFEAADTLYRELRVTEDILGRAVNLDDEVELALIPLSNVIAFREEPQAEEVTHGS